MQHEAVACGGLCTDGCLDGVVTQAGDRGDDRVEPREGCAPAGGRPPGADAPRHFPFEAAQLLGLQADPLLEARQRPLFDSLSGHLSSNPRARCRLPRATRHLGRSLTRTRLSNKPPGKPMNVLNSMSEHKSVRRQVAKAQATRGRRVASSRDSNCALAASRSAVSRWTMSRRYAVSCSTLGACPANRPERRENRPANDGQGRYFQQMVDAMEHYGNRRPRVERLVSAWNQGIRENAESEDGADDPLIGASAEPKKRPRTRLTDEEVDAMRTARAQGVSVNALARRFGVHRGTVWAKTR